MHAVGMPFQDVLRFAGFDIPDPRRAVEAAGSQPLAVGRKRHVEHHVGVPLQQAHSFAA